MSNSSSLTRKEQVHNRLMEASPEWVDGPELANEACGGSEGLKRLRELRSEVPATGWSVESRKHPDPERDIWQYRIVPFSRVSPLRGSYVAPAGDPDCPVHGSTCRKVWHRKGLPDCSCGEGPVGHSTTHETTDKPGIVRIVREGKTDQYMNIGAVRAQHAAEMSAAAREEERKAREDGPRRVLRARDIPFGSRICSRCNGTGGTVRDACISCAGEGYR